MKQLEITHLSFSRLKQLALSPTHLKHYLEKTFEPSDAMNEGSYLDCLLFTPDDVESRFFICPEKYDRRTKEGKAGHAQMILDAGDRVLMTSEQNEMILGLAGKIRTNATVTRYGLLEPGQFRFQARIKFAWLGFNHYGVADAQGVTKFGEDCIWDLKKIGAKTGERQVRWEIRSGKYDLQAAIYCHLFDEDMRPIRYFVIAINNDGDVTPFEISFEARMEAKKEWRKLVKAAHRCNMEGLAGSCEFWAKEDGFFMY